MIIVFLFWQYENSYLPWSDTWRCKWRRALFLYHPIRPDADAPDKIKNKFVRFGHHRTKILLYYDSWRYRDKNFEKKKNQFFTTILLGKNTHGCQMRCRQHHRQNGGHNVASARLFHYCVFLFCLTERNFTKIQYRYWFYRKCFFFNFFNSPSLTITRQSVDDSLKAPFAVDSRVFIPVRLVAENRNNN